MLRAVLGTTSILRFYQNLVGLRFYHSEDLVRRNCSMSSKVFQNNSPPSPKTFPRCQACFANTAVSSTILTAQRRLARFCNFGDPRVSDPRRRGSTKLLGDLLCWKGQEKRLEKRLFDRVSGASAGHASLRSCELVLSRACSARIRTALDHSCREVYQRRADCTCQREAIIQDMSDCRLLRKIRGRKTHFRIRTIKVQ